jgi:competence/damage-inducible protein CinA-like protein
MQRDPDSAGATSDRRFLTAELLAIGTELTVGETVDTNSGEIARSLVMHGVRVTRVADLPDDIDVVTDALHAALDRADLVVTTGGLGPTPDDLTREAVAAVCGEQVAVDPAILAWLEELWARRGVPFPAVNAKQAWLIPSATSLPNPNGTAPGWWVDRPDGRVIVLLPGPPREMRPMWAEQVLPRLAERGVGAETEVRTLRLHGVGESQVAELLGEPLLRAPNPVVATYARRDAVDVRISARTEDGRAAADLAGAAEREVLAALGDKVWARGDTSWADAVASELAQRGWGLATTEVGTGGALVVLFRDMAGLRRADVVAVAADATPASDEELLGAARTAQEAAAAEVGMAVQATPHGKDLDVRIAVITPEKSRTARRIAFTRGSYGADRAAIASAAVLLETLRGTADS